MMLFILKRKLNICNMNRRYFTDDIDVSLLNYEK